MPWLVLLLVQPLFVVLALRPGVSGSRRWLAASLALVVPLVGPLLAILVRRVRGRTPGAGGDPLEAVTRRFSADDVRRVSALPPLLDRLMSTDAEVRMTALVSASSNGDAAAVALLRWVVEYGQGDVALESALAIEELDLRREARLELARHAVAVGPSFERALAAADAAACGILTGVADPATTDSLAAEAREYYRQAIALAPGRHVEIDERRARLELAVGAPAAALAILSATDGDEISRQRAHPLRDAAAFAARRFDLLAPTHGAPARRSRRASRRAATGTRAMPCTRWPTRSDGRSPRVALRGDAARCGVRGDAEPV